MFGALEWLIFSEWCGCRMECEFEMKQRSFYFDMHIRTFLRQIRVVLLLTIAGEAFSEPGQDCCQPLVAAASLERESIGRLVDGVVLFSPKGVLLSRPLAPVPGDAAVWGGLFMKRRTRSGSLEG